MILACDPGLGGAFALYGGGSLTVTNMPVHMNDGRRVIDAPDVLAQVRLFKDLGATRLVIEDVHGAPGQSAPAAFTFGYGVGVVTMAAMSCGYEIERVAPSVWKRALKVPSDKRAARARASELLPAYGHLWPRQKDDGRAEAAMIALYAERFMR